ncbi:MAG: hypothetical protein CSA81_10705 [Acidobacteria bacterium]|nr:MAG: hypothetical protein CSA81_10705 [Acidobacteriota bacterium]
MSFGAQYTFQANPNGEFGNRTLALTAGVKNLTDEFQEDFNQGAYRDSACVYSPRFPRSVYAFPNTISKITTWLATLIAAQIPRMQAP